MPPDDSLELIHTDEENQCCYCVVYSDVEVKVNAKFEVLHINWDKFVPRGEFGSRESMATYRTVWTAIKNGYFMSGFTNIPSEALKQGVVTSVNLERHQNQKGIHPHVHPEYPELYLFCIDDRHFYLLIDIRVRF